MNAVMLGSLRVRAATSDDLAACLRLDLTYETEYAWQVDLRDEAGAIAISFRTARLPRQLRATYPRSAALLESALTWLPTEGRFWVAEVDGQVVGYAILRLDPSRAAAHLSDLAIDRPMRRRKFGTALLNTAITAAAEVGAAHFVVEAKTKNYPAICFCQKNGLVFCGFNDMYYANHDIALFFGQNVRTQNDAL
jgi:ribosomal protein S18 acetylase RimI-like enzyme